jgi:hypothetical protein
MELLGYHGITADEECLIKEKLAHFTSCSLTSEIEEAVINLRKKRKYQVTGCNYCRNGTLFRP